MLAYYRNKGMHVSTWLASPSPARSEMALPNPAAAIVEMVSTAPIEMSMYSPYMYTHNQKKT